MIPFSKFEELNIEMESKNTDISEENILNKLCCHRIHHQESVKAD